MTDLVARIEAATEADQAAMLYEAWEYLADWDADFRRFALILASRFAKILDAEAFESAALMLVPGEYAKKCTFGWAIDGNAFASVPWGNLTTAATPALALCAAALKAREAGQ